MQCFATKLRACGHVIATCNATKLRNKISPCGLAFRLYVYDVCYCINYEHISEDKVEIYNRHHSILVL